MVSKYSFFSAVVLCSSLLVGNSDIDYQQLKYWHMCSEGLAEKDLAALDVKCSHEQKLQPSQQSKIYKIFKVYDILNNLTTHYFRSEDDSVNAATLMRDLEVYCGSGDHPEVNVASVLDRTHSASGAVVLRNMLACPIAAKRNQEFVNRQELIRALVADQDLYHEIDALCRLWAENEDRMLSNWQAIDEVTAKLIDDNYYKKRVLSALNTNAYMMELAVRTGNIADLLRATQIPLILASIGVGGHLCALKMSDQTQSSLVQLLPRALKNYCNIDLKNDYRSMIHPVAFCKESLREYDAQIALEQMQAARIGKPWTQEQTEIFAYMRSFFKGCLIATPVLNWALSAYVTYNAKKVFDQAKTHQDVLNFIHNRLIGMGTAIRSAVRLNAMTNRYGTIEQGLVSWQHMTDLFDNNTDASFVHLLNLLQKDTFTGNASFFSLEGRVLAAHKLMEAYKNKFAGMIELMGELDACRSIAQLVTEFSDRSVHYCFAELHETDQPYLKLTNFWNPFVDHRIVVPNDIALGGEKQEQLVILTGSNTGGKSTVGLKGTLLNLYLAHTVGIAPSDACNASLFYDFGSYLKVSDDVASGQSSFQAEVNRTKAFINQIEQLDQNEHAFIAIDELFKGTSPEKGAYNAYQIIKHIARFKNVICIVATHFKELTKLQDDMDNYCINMKIDVYEDEHGNLIRPHKLEYGVSTQNIADTIMQSHFENIDFTA